MAVFTGNGSSASPSFTFSSATTTGIFRRGNGAIGLSIGNSDNHQFNANGTSFFNHTTLEVSQTGVINHGTRFATLIAYGENPTTGNIVYLDSGSAYQNLVMYGDSPGSADGAWVVESASVPGSGASTQAMWLKTASGGGTGSTRHDLWVDGAVRTGGTLPSSPNIVLGSDGNIDQSGDLENNGGINKALYTSIGQNGTSTGTGTIRLSNLATLAGTVYRGGFARFSIAVGRLGGGFSDQQWAEFFVRFSGVSTYSNHTITRLHGDTSISCSAAGGTNYLDLTISFTRTGSQHVSIIMQAAQATYAAPIAAITSAF